MTNLPAVEIWYFASPYSRYADGIWPAYKEAARIAGRLVDSGVTIYSPIVHTHPLAIYGDLDPLAHAQWMTFDAPFMRVCGGLIVACMDGWRESKGVAEEIIAFRAAGKPILYCDPRTLAVTAEPEGIAA